MADHRSVGRQAVDKLAGAGAVKERHFLPEDGGEQSSAEVPDDLLSWAGKEP